jgi:hypothetical protein
MEPLSASSRAMLVGSNPYSGLASQLSEPLEALRRWGVTYLTDPTADGSTSREFDIHYVEGIEALEDAEYGLVIDGTPSTLRFSRGHLEHGPGLPENPALTVHTTRRFHGPLGSGRGQLGRRARGRRGPARRA